MDRENKTSTDGLRPYNAGPGPDNSLRRLHLNEFRHKHHPRVVRAAEAAAGTGLAEYATVADQELLEALTAFTGASARNIVLTAGSDELLRAIVDVCAVRKIQDVLCGVPTYTHFKHFVQLRGLRWTEYAIGLQTDTASLRTPLEYYHEMLARGALVYLGSPNNPTGSIWDQKTITKLATRYEDSIFLVDEAYIEFAGCRDGQEQDGGDSPAGVMNRCSAAGIAAVTPNVIVARTFSKAFGLAHLRIGYGIASDGLVEQLRVVINPKSVTRVASAAARQCLSEDCLPHYYQATLEAVRVRESLVSWLRERSWFVCGSRANFLLLHVGDVPTAVDHLQRKGVLVRDRSAMPELHGFVRITAGTEEDSRALRAGLEELARPANPPIQKFYTPKDTIGAIKVLLRVVARVLEEHNVSYWLDSGTLLGAVRHEGLVPWDDDADIAYFWDTEKEPDPAQGLAYAFAEQGLTLQRNRTDAYWQVGTNTPGDALSDVHVDLFPFMVNRVPLDFPADQNPIGPYLVNADKRFRVPDPNSKNADCNLSFESRDEVFPCDKAKFYDLQLPVPAKCLVVLERALGSNFMEMAVVRSGPRDSGAPALTFDLPPEHRSPA